MPKKCLGGVLPVLLIGKRVKVAQGLEREPAPVGHLARAVLDANFPESLRPELAAEVGLDVEAAESSAGGGKRRRNPDFRGRVLRAYGNRCALCRVKLHVGLAPLGLEAAHIRWSQFDGPDEVPNGLSLCAFHHKAFDLGAFRAEPGGRVLVSEELNGDGPDVLLSGVPCGWIRRRAEKTSRGPSSSTGIGPRSSGAGPAGDGRGVEAASFTPSAETGPHDPRSGLLHFYEP